MTDNALPAEPTGGVFLAAFHDSRLRYDEWVLTTRVGRLWVKYARKREALGKPHCPRCKGISLFRDTGADYILRCADCLEPIVT